MPDLTKNSQLRVLLANNNALTGTIPSIPGTQLKALALGSNRLHGLLPDVRNHTTLQILDVANNKLSGSISTEQLTHSMKYFSIHRNSFTGELPSFEALGEVVVLSVFGNNFNGQLRLPMKAPLKAILAQNNELSQAVVANFSVNAYSPELSPLKHGLIAPGNYLHAPVPQW